MCLYNVGDPGIRFLPLLLTSDRRRRNPQRQINRQVQIVAIHPRPCVHVRRSCVTRRRALHRPPSSFRRRRQMKMQG